MTTQKQMPTFKANHEYLLLWKKALQQAEQGMNWQTELQSTQNSKELIILWSVSKIVISCQIKIFAEMKI